MRILDKIEAFKVSSLAAIPGLMNLAEFNHIVVSLTGVLALVYLVYKILESHEKRRFWKRKQKEEFKDK